MNRALLGGWVTMILLSVPPAHADLLFCTADVPSVPVLDPLSTSAAVGELILTCGGGEETAPLPLVSFQAFLNVPLLQTVTPVLTDGVSDYAGVFTTSNEVSFSGVPIDPVSSSFTFRHILVDPSEQVEDFLFVQFVSITGLITVPIDDPMQIVAINGRLPARVPEPLTAVLVVGGLALLAAPSALRRQGRPRRAVAAGSHRALR